MTPNNILNMAMLNQIDLLAITDHNSTKQLKVIKTLQESYDFILIPGIEVSVKEGFDCLCYFRKFQDAEKFGNIIENYLTNNWKNYTADDQVITDIYDGTFDTFNKPLIETSILYKTLYKEVKKLNGAIVLAHINRPSCTPLSVFDLNKIDFDGIEISPYKREEFLKMHPELTQYTIFHNSDSHTLLQLHDKRFSIQLKEKSIKGFFDYLVGD